MQACLYCESAAGDLPQAVLFEDAQVVAFLDWRQTAPGHVLIVPRRHLCAEEVLESGVGAAVLRAAARVARAVAETVAPDGLQMGAILYPAAGMWRGSGAPHAGWVPAESEERTTEDGHFHLHLVPRRHAGTVARIFPYGDQVARAEQLQGLALRIRAAMPPADTPLEGQWQRGPL